MLENNGGALSQATSYSRQDVIVDIALGDFDDDGDNDLVLCSSGAVEIHENLGSLALQAVSRTEYPASSFSSVSVGDINRDGVEGLVVGESQRSGIRASLGGGDLTFALPHRYYVRRGVRWPIVQDLNGNGRPEVVAVPGDWLSVLPGLGR